ncbi:MAG: glutamate racemase [Mariprofundaceae bacterium]|nr:glutamate racemase [Mariprofundaceae bacterium]
MIGIFDSGVGGLSIASSIRALLPNEHILYIADSAHAPYGDKPVEFIEERASAIIAFLMERNVKAVVVACNTATVSAIHKLRANYAIPMIGVEPGIKPAILKSRSGVVGVLATTQTLKSASFSELSQRFSTHVTVEVQPCPGLVEQVEALNLDSEETEALIKRYVFPLLEKGADHIVLGCTHYAYLTPAIQKVIGPNITIINTATAVATELARRLELECLLSTRREPGRDEFWSSGLQHIATEQLSKLWGKPVDVLQL